MALTYWDVTDVFDECRMLDSDDFRDLQTVAGSQVELSILLIKVNQASCALCPMFDARHHRKMKVVIQMERLNSAGSDYYSANCQSKYIRLCPFILSYLKI